MDELEIRRKVRDRYGGQAAPRSGSAPSECCGSAVTPLDQVASGEDGAVPRLGVGDPMENLAPRPGEVVLDLGSGPGRDVLYAAKLVGPNGRAIGVDATPEMVFRAREAAASLHRDNAEFRLGEIEHLPVESESVDGIASDCVVNLAPDKAQVFREAFRVLRAGGRIVVSDVVADREFSPEVRQDAERWAACEAGAVTEAEYVALMRAAGFEDVHAERKGGYREGLSRAVVRGLKPPRHG
jgi:arsenite methyltransferase